KPVRHSHINTLHCQKADADRREPHSCYPASCRKDTHQAREPFRKRGDDPGNIRKNCDKCCRRHERSPQYRVSSCINGFMRDLLIKSFSPWTTAYLSFTPSTCSRLTR